MQKLRHIAAVLSSWQNFLKKNAFWLNTPSKWHIYLRHKTGTQCVWDLTFLAETFSIIPFDMVPMPTSVMSKLNFISDNSIPELLARQGLSVVLMSSSWDGNGIIMRSIVESLTDNFHQVEFCQAEYENTPQLARLFNLLNPPGLLLIKDGELVNRITKPMSAKSIRAIIQASA